MPRTSRSNEILGVAPSSPLAVNGNVANKRVKIEKQDFIFIVTILIATELVKVVANENEAEGLTIGDKVLVASKAFNPIIKKIQ